MKRFFAFTFIIVFIVLFNVSLGTYALGSFEKNSEDRSGKIIRLQTVASSDGDFDQFIKYELSDAILLYIVELFDFYKNLTYDKAVSLLCENVKSIKKLCEDTAIAEGCSDKIDVEFVFFQKDKYNSVNSIYKEKFPYLRIIIGEGKGQNCQRILWNEKSKAGFYEEEKYSLADSVFPKNVKINIWIVNMMKKIISAMN